MDLGGRQAERVADASRQAWVIEARQPAPKVDNPGSCVMVLEQARKLGDGQAERPALVRTTASDVGNQGRDLGEVGKRVARTDYGAAIWARLWALDNPTGRPKVCDTKASRQILELGSGGLRKADHQGDRAAAGPPDDDSEVDGSPTTADQDRYY
jgi:hypothetical protein